MPEVQSIDPWRKTTEHRLAYLQGLQERRIALMVQRKREFDEIIARHQREIDNLRATLEVEG